MVELSDDLLETIGSYSVPSTTYRLITLGPDLSARTAYRPSFWRRKVVYERRGLIFDDAVIRDSGASYHTYYRLINTREYGMAYQYNAGTSHTPLASGAAGIGISSADEEVVLIFPDRVTVKTLSSSRYPNGDVDMPIRGTVECFHRSHQWLFLTEAGLIYRYQFGVLYAVPSSVPVVEMFLSGPGDFLGRDGEIYRFRPGEQIPLETVQHTRPFVLRGGYEVLAFEANGAAIITGELERFDVPVAVTLPSEWHGQTLLLDGDTMLLGRVTKQEVPVCRVLRDISSKLTIDGVLRGPDDMVSGILEACADGRITIVLR